MRATSTYSSAHAPAPETHAARQCIPLDPPTTRHLISRSIDKASPVDYLMTPALERAGFTDARIHATDEQISLSFGPDDQRTLDRLCDYHLAPPAESLAILLTRAQSLN